MHYLDLPVYKHKDLILSALAASQVAVVESPTGSGKTTQMPVIAYEAGYGTDGIIGVTQPRRIAALSVSEFIARQMGTPGLVGYKMRFEDNTSQRTRIKIMTDGILLQEMKLDPFLSKYRMLIVDEAHERSLNIDFILGLLKRVLEARQDFKVIVSSATINAEVFSEYFGECPVVKIDAITYPVTLISDPPALSAPPSPRTEGPRPRQFRGGGQIAEEAMMAKISQITERFISERREGDILIFLPGEKLIKDCMNRLAAGSAGKYLHMVPLYGRLGKDEQERVFDAPPPGKTKAVIATNIAETSVTIDGITAVIDSGLSKLNYYSPKTFTSSLIEGPISKASGNQRKGRAGRTREGTCYRLYTRRDFENRPLFTTEEIYRTDLSEVVLRMADLGITAFEEFNFISSPEADGIVAAIETLNLLEALEKDRSLSPIGKMMTEFPLAPRQSRIIVEALRRCPQVTGETIIAAAFLSTQSPYVLPPGEETDARRAHHRFRDPGGDFVSYLRLYRAYQDAPHKGRFCEKNYLDEKVMAEIVNVTAQLEETVSAMGMPLLSGGPEEDYLCAVATGLIQFVCVREGRELYRSLTADRILIHPGSVMFKLDPPYIVAGEIVRTTRTYAMSVSPLSRDALEKISPGLCGALGGPPPENAARGGRPERQGPDAEFPPGPRSGLRPGLRPWDKLKQARDFTNNIKIGSEMFEIQIVKGKKVVTLPWERLAAVKDEALGESRYQKLRGVITIEGKYTLLAEEKLPLILRLARTLCIDGALERKAPRRERYHSQRNLEALLHELPGLLCPALWKPGRKELGFICLLTDGGGGYRFTCSRGFHAALNESLASLETLIDELGEAVDRELKHIVNQTYRRLSDLLGGAD
jgi:HrpA-like RNA helicase